jgi:hypothetical protein
MFQGMLTALGTISLLGGIVLILAGAVMFLVAAFRTSILWGLGVLFVPFVSLIFLIAEWPVAKRPFFWKLWGLALLVLGVILLPDHFHHVH